MEVRLDIDDAFLKELQKKIGHSTKAADLALEALGMFNWAIEEVAAGRMILSTDAAGEDVRRLVMPALSQAEIQAKAQASARAA